MKDIKIISGNIKDAVKIVDYLKKMQLESPDTLFKRDYTPTVEEEKNYLYSLFESGGIIFLAKHKRKVVGILTAQRYKHPQLKHSVVIGISVLKEYRNQGIGTNLLMTVYAWAIINKIRRIELEVFSNNPIAISLYKKTGYVVEGIKKGAVLINGKYYDIIQMANYINYEVVKHESIYNTN